MNTFLMASITVVVYVIIQIADAKMVQKERPDIKAIVRRSIMVFSSVVAGVALYDQFNPLMGQLGDKVGSMTGGSDGAPTQVFTDKPAF
jgi:ABC-type spermidine/putrescine transport system permease subunit II